MPLDAVIFDLDGVITDTAEYHYRAWKKMTDEEGLPFDREANERLRGVSRSESLRRILGQHTVSEAKFRVMMERKNDYYQEMLAQVSPADLLPGVAELLNELDAAEIPYAIASASRNARDAVERLGLAGRLELVADGNSVQRQKPAPDLFRYAAARLRIPPGHCLVVEDAAAGIEAALAAGMPALALGPAERFSRLWHDDRLAQRPGLEGVTLADLQAIVSIDPGWHVSQGGFAAANQHHMETVFTLGNGYFSSRGALAEGYPGDVPITFAHGVFDDAPIVITELANLPNWLDFSLTVDGDCFRLDQGQTLHFQRDMDLRRGILRREVRWQAPNGAILDLTFERFASYAREHVGALRVLATAVNLGCHVRIGTGIDGHVSNQDLLHWHHLDQGQDDSGLIWLHSRTRHSGIELATAATVTTPAGTVTCQQCPGQPRFHLEQVLAPGQTVQVDKVVAYTAGRDAVAGAGKVVERALDQVAGQSYDALRAEHVAAWLDLWRDCDVVIEGDLEAQIAVRFSLFQLLVAAPQHDNRVSIAAKTLSGFGYRGHVFWDTEIFILPFFTYTLPHIARNLLMYRYHTLAGARRKAAANGYGGAQYAWESAVSGDEVTPTWVPSFDGKSLVRIWTGDIEIHISADIAYAIYQYWHVTGDDAFMRDYGAEIILDTARFWAERAELEESDGQRRYAFRDVIGPDEYHDHVDNNIFTNRMVQWHLVTAHQILDWLKQEYPDKANHLTTQLDLTGEALDHWREVIDHVIIHHNRETGLMLQFDDFFEREPIDWESYVGRTESLQVLLGIEGANQSQVIKQADVLMLLCLLRDEYDEKTWRANWETYMPLTDHSYGSSLGPSFHAWAACAMGRPEEAYQHFMLAARADLRDIRGNAGDGIHGASAGGLWQALVFGFAGLRLTEAGPTVKPTLPDDWRRLAFHIYYRGQRYYIDIQPDKEPKVVATGE